MELWQRNSKNLPKLRQTPYLHYQTLIDLLPDLDKQIKPILAKTSKFHRFVKCDATGKITVNTLNTRKWFANHPESINNGEGTFESLHKTRLFGYETQIILLRFRCSD
jgi:hypothetical protein